jgi:hypothetical protein
MATNKFSDPTLNPTPPTPVHTGLPAFDVYLNTPAETHRYGDHTVEIHRDPITHMAVTEDWRDKDGKFDRADGPAVITRDPKTGIVCTEEWWKNDKLHRLDGPAIVNRDARTGVVSCEAWYKNGNLSRNNGPALTVRDPSSGSVLFQKGAQDGVLTDDFTLISSAFPSPIRPSRDSAAQADDTSYDL